MVGEADGPPAGEEWVEAGALLEGVASVSLPPRESWEWVRQELPDAPMKFVNRDVELERLDELLRTASDSTGAVVGVLSGLHGVGKSAIGSYWARKRLDRFADGHLFGDLSPRRHRGRVEVGDVLADFIRDLGTEDALIPASLHERTKLFKKLTAGRRLLVLLDDADWTAEVKSLLPSGPGSVVVLTSNSYHEELLAAGAELIEVEPLEPPVARELLAKMARPTPIEPEDPAADSLLSICAGLPIAICVCGGRLAANSTRGVSWLVDRIAAEASRLEGLSGSGEMSVKSLFDFAYSDLEEGRALAYRRLGLFPGPAPSATHVAVLLDVPVPVALSRLEALRGTHLVEALPAERFSLHEMVRAHTRECAERDDDEVAQEGAQRRLVDWYALALQAADRAITPDRLRLAPRIEAGARPLPVLESAGAAFRWFEAERANIIEILRLTAARQWDRRGWDMAEALWPFYSNRKHYADWIEAMEIGIACAERAGDRQAEGRIRALLARAYIDLRKFELARPELDRAEAAVSGSENLRLQGSVREFVGVCRVNEGQLPEALEAFGEAREMFERFGGRRGVAIQDYQIGRALTRQGNPGRAIAPLRSALEAMRGLGDDLFVARILLRMAQAKREEAGGPAARREIEQALVELVRQGLRLEQGEAFEELAEIAEAEGEGKVAAEYRQRARKLYREVGHPRAEEVGSS